MLYRMWSSRTALAITAEEKAELERIVRSGRTEQRHALRARIILGAAEGRSHNALAKELKTSRPTIVDWRARYREGGVKALFEDRPRGRSFEAVARSKEAEIIAKTQSPPADATHWSCRRMAETCGGQQSIRAAYLADQWVKTAPGQNIQTIKRSSFH